MWIQEKVEIEAKIVGEKGRLISVIVEIKKKDNAELVAVGRVWITTDDINRYPESNDQNTTTPSKLWSLQEYWSQIDGYTTHLVSPNLFLFKDGDGPEV